MKRTKPYDRKNHALVCKLYFMGNKCWKGDECPYRHEGPVMGDPKEAVNMDSPYKMRPLEPLDDKSIRTLCVGDVRFNQEDIRDVILAHGEIETIEMGPSSGCVVVTYTTREGAEKAMKELLNTLVNGMGPRVMWYVPQLYPNSFEPSSDAIQHARNIYKLKSQSEYRRCMMLLSELSDDEINRTLCVGDVRFNQQDLRDVNLAHGEIIETIEMKRTNIYDKKNNVPICKLYFLGNKCRRGDLCIYRHEGPVMGGPKEAINMDWPYKMRPLEPLDDKSIRTLCVGDVRFNQQDLRDVILAHGEIETIERGPSSGCVVVTYTTREGAVKGLKELLNTLVNGMRPRVVWLRMPQVDAHPHSLGNSSKLSSDAIQQAIKISKLRQSKKKYCRYEPIPVKPPNDKSSRILYVTETFGGIDEQDLKDVISAYGEIESIEMDPSKDCAVVTYTTRQGAEMAAKELSDKVVNGTRLMVSWYVPQLEPDLIQPDPYPTTQFSNLKLEPNMPNELSAAKTCFDMSTEAGSKFQY